MGARDKRLASPWRRHRTPGRCPGSAAAFDCGDSGARVTTASAVVMARRPAPGEEGARGGSARPLRKPGIGARGLGKGSVPGPHKVWPGQPGGGPAASDQACGTCLDRGGVEGGRLTVPWRQAGLPKCSAWPGKAAGEGSAFGTLCISVRPVVRLGWGGDGPEVRKGLWSCCPGLVPPAALRLCGGECQAFAHSLANARC